MTKLEESDQARVEKVTKLAAESEQASEHSLTAKQQALIEKMKGELGLKELMALLGQTHRSNFKNNQLQPLLAADIVAIKYPDNPNHPEQAYSLTEAGLGLQIKIRANDSK